MSYRLFRSYPVLGLAIVVWIAHQDLPTFRLVAVSSFQLGASAPIQYANSARFSRGDSKPNSPIRRDSMNAAAQAASIARAPSPETIARMSVDPATNPKQGSSTGSTGGAGGGRNSSGQRSVPSSPTLEAPPRPWEQQQSISQITDPENDEEVSPPMSPRSPKPEADGKLDRKFKFPTSDSRPGTPTQAIASGSVGTGPTASTSASTGSTGPATSDASNSAVYQAKKEEGEVPAEPISEEEGSGAEKLEPQDGEKAEEAVPSETVSSTMKGAVEAEAAAIDDLITGGKEGKTKMAEFVKERTAVEGGTSKDTEAIEETKIPTSSEPRDSEVGPDDRPEDGEIVESKIVDDVPIEAVERKETHGTEKEGKHGAEDGEVVSESGKLEGDQKDEANHEDVD